MNLERFKKKYTGLRKSTRIISAKAKQYNVKVYSISYLKDFRSIKTIYAHGNRRETFYIDAFGFPIVTRKRCDFAISRLLNIEIEEYYL